MRLLVEKQWELPGVGVSAAGAERGQRVGSTAPGAEGLCAGCS